MTINALNLDTVGDHVKNVLWQAVDLPLLSSMENIVTLCKTNNIPMYSPQHIADWIISIGSIFQKKSNSITVSVCGLILCDECWLVNRVLINEVNETLEYQCNINGFAFIFQDHG